MTREELGKALIDAANLLHEFTVKNLPRGYYIEMQLDWEESSIYLYDRYHERVPFDATGDDASIRELVNHARELEGMEAV